MKLNEVFESKSSLINELENRLREGIKTQPDETDEKGNDRVLSWFIRDPYVVNYHFNINSPFHPYNITKLDLGDLVRAMKIVRDFIMLLGFSIRRNPDVLIFVKRLFSFISGVYSVKRDIEKYEGGKAQKAAEESLEESKSGKELVNPPNGWRVEYTRSVKTSLKKYGKNRRVLESLEDILNFIFTRNDKPPMDTYPSQYNVHPLSKDARFPSGTMWAHLMGQKIGLIFFPDYDKKILYVYCLGTHQDCGVGLTTAI